MNKEIDQEALSNQELRLTNKCDDSGRPIVFCDPSHCPQRGAMDTAAVANWYMLHSLFAVHDHSNNSTTNSPTNSSKGTPNSHQKEMAQLQDTNPKVVAQQKGIIYLAYPQKATLSQFDQDRYLILMEILRGALPIRVAAFHICHPPIVFCIVFPIFKLYGRQIAKKGQGASRESGEGDGDINDQVWKHNFQCTL